MSHYSRSKKMLEDAGYATDRGEFWNSFTHTRHDRFGIIDLFAIDGENPILAVQITDGNKAHEHLVKALGNTFLPLWLKSGGRFEIHAWRILLQDNKDGKRGKRGKYECRIIELVWDGKDMTTKTKEKA